MSLLSQLQNDPVRFLISFLYQAPAILIALTLHELAHGYVALRCGDPTAQMMGRLSFNPMKHLSLSGTICMFILGVGWAKPVPINPRNFKNYRKDTFWVSIAGILANLILFLTATILSAACIKLMFPNSPMGGKEGSFFLNINNVGFAYLLTGKENVGMDMMSLFGARFGFLQYVLRFLCNFSIINLNLALFNLLPVPPLDGYRLFNVTFLKNKLHLSPTVMNICIIILLVVNFSTNFIGNFIFKIVSWVQTGVLFVILPIFGMV